MFFWVYILLSYSYIISTEKISKSACDDNLPNNYIEYSGVQNDFANLTYVNQHKVHVKHYKSTGDNLQYPLSNAFDTSNTDTFWAASTPNNDTFHNSIIVEFNHPVTIEEILYHPSITTIINTDDTKIRIFNGSPKKLKIYTSLYNENFKLESLFIGTPKTEWDQFQFVLPNPAYCDKIKLEFVEVTKDTLISNGSYTPISRGITFLQKNNGRSLLYDESGSCGTGVSYLIAANILSITGNGEMDDFASYAAQPWRSYIGQITKITINYDVKKIGACAFQYMNKVTEVTIGSNVETIEHYSFYSMDLLSVVEIPASVKTIRNDAFILCSELTAINVDSRCQYYKSSNGVLFDNQFQYLMCYPPAKTDTSYSLPTTVNSISEKAFAICPHLTSFSTYDAKNLYKLDENIFDGMINVVTFEIGYNIGSICNEIFNKMEKLEKIVVHPSNSVFSSDNGVLYNKKGELLNYPAAKSSTSFTFPSTVKTINRYAFVNVKKLQSFSVDQANNYFRSKDGVLFSTDYKILMCYPPGKTTSSYTIPYGVTTIYNHSFTTNLYLSSISFPETVTVISSYSFYKANSLKTVKMSNSVKEIGLYAFYFVETLSSITISNNLEIIGYGAFQHCPALQSIIIPQKVTSIPNYAFYSTGLVEVTILGDLDSIEYASFGFSRSLSYILYMGTKVPSCEHPFSENEGLVVYVFNDYKETKFCNLPVKELYTRYFTASNKFTDSDLFTNSMKFTLSSQFTYTNDFTQSYSFTESAAFSYSSHFSRSSAFSESIPFEPTALLILNISGSYGNTNYSIYEKVLTISASGNLEKCDADCPYLEFISEIEKIIISDDVTKIGKDAFNNFENLLTVEIPESVTLIEESAFQSCINLTTIEIPNCVTEIGANCFNNCTSLKSVQLSDKITELPNDLFNGCTSLEEVILPENVEKIGKNCFINCTSLVTITLPNTVNEIQNNAFSGCSSLLKIDIPSKVTTISSSTFSQCTSLESVSLHDDISQIQPYSFYNCTSLLSFDVKSADLIIFDHSFEFCNKMNSFSIYGYINAIGEYSFAYCYSLSTLKIISDKASLLNSDNVADYYSNEISNYAFYNCFALSSFIIAEGIVKIGSNSFDGCSNLLTLSIPSTVTEIGSKAFQNINNIDIYFYGSEEPRYQPDLFDNTQINKVYVTESYKGKEKLFGYNFEVIQVTKSVEITYLFSKSITMVARKWMRKKIPTWKFQVFFISHVKKTWNFQVFFFRVFFM